MQELRRRNKYSKLEQTESDNDEFVEDEEYQKKTPLKKVGELINGVENVAKDSFFVVEAVVSKSVPMIIEFAVPLLIFIGIGFTLVFLRFELIKGAPYISSHAKKFAVMANGVEKIFAVVLDTVKGLVFSVRFLIDLVSPNHSRPNIPKWFWPKTEITANEVISFADALTFCSNTTTIDSIKIISQYTGNKYVCPVLRAATPLRWINTTVLPAFNWLAFNYTPMAQDEETGLGNCREPEDYREALCAGLQAGHILLEILIPVAFGALVFITILAPVVKLVLSSSKLVWTASIDALHIIKF